jgi:hypothetical protein
MSKAPPKETCLQMAKLNHDWKNETKMWEWLICWGFYEHWVEGYWNEPKGH